MMSYTSRFGVGDLVKFRHPTKGDEPKWGIVTSVRFYKPTMNESVAYEIQILNTNDHANGVLEECVDCNYGENKNG